MEPITSTPTPEDIAAALAVSEQKRAVFEAARQDADAARLHYEALVSYRGEQSSLSDAVGGYFKSQDEAKARALELQRSPEFANAMAALAGTTGPSLAPPVAPIDAAKSRKLKG